MIVYTNRLIIRQIEMNDADAVFQYRSDEITNKFQGWIPKSIEDVQVFIQNSAKKLDIINTWFQMVIIEKTSNEIIGDLGIHFIGVNNKEVEIGCTISKNYQNKGIATEALKAIIHHVFEGLGKEKIIGSVDPQNHNSIKLLRRLDFEELFQEEKTKYIHDKWENDKIFELNKTKWKDSI